MPGLGSPCAAVDAVVALGAPWVTGNGEQWVLDTPGYARNPSTPQGRMVVWTCEQLGPERLARLRGLPQGLVLRLGAPGAVWVAHGAPPNTIQPGIRPTGLQEWTGVLEDDDVERALGEPAPGLLLCGHTPIPLSLALPSGRCDSVRGVPRGAEGFSGKALWPVMATFNRAAEERRGALSERHWGIPTSGPCGGSAPHCC